jgi:hypothetical protein
MKSMHKTSAEEKRNDLQMTAQGLAQDERALQETTRATRVPLLGQGLHVERQMRQPPKAKSLKLQARLEVKR